MTFRVQVGAAPGPVAPNLLSTTHSVFSTNATSYSFAHSGWNAGDIIVIAVCMDGDNNWHDAGAFTITAPDGETVTLEQDFLGSNLNNNLEHSAALFSFKAAANRSAGTMAATWSASDAGHFAVMRFEGGTVKDAAPRLGFIVSDFEASDGTPRALAIPGMTDLTESARIYALAAVADHTVTGDPASGWTTLVNNRATFHTMYLGARTAAATALEDTSAVNLSTSTPGNWVTIGFAVLPA